MLLFSNSTCHEDIFLNIFFKKVALIYLPAGQICLNFENFCLEKILRDLETFIEFLDYLILRFLSPLLPIFSDLCRIYVLQSIVQKNITSKMGFQHTISNFLKFVAFSAPNEITNNWKTLILCFCKQHHAHFTYNSEAIFQ